MQALNILLSKNHLPAVHTTFQAFGSAHNRKWTAQMSLVVHGKTLTTARWTSYSKQSAVEPCANEMHALVEKVLAAANPPPPPIHQPVHPPAHRPFVSVQSPSVHSPPIHQLAFDDFQTPSSCQQVAEDKTLEELDMYAAEILYMVLPLKKTLCKIFQGGQSVRVFPISHGKDMCAGFFVANTIYIVTGPAQLLQAMSCFHTVEYYGGSFAWKQHFALEKKFTVVDCTVSSKVHHWLQTIEQQVRLLNTNTETVL
jgi:hypothetical protein